MIRAFSVTPLLCFLFASACSGLLAAGPKPTSKKSSISFKLDEGPRTKDTLEAHLRALKEDSDSCILQLELALDYLSLAGEQNWGYLTKAVEHLNKVRKYYPQDPIVLIHLGRAVGARSLDMKPSTLQRLRWARTGFKYMDTAVKLNSTDFYLRLLRAEAQLLAHPILRRGKALKEDINMLLHFADGTAFDPLPAFQKARFHLFLGNYQEAAKRSEQAREHWQKAVSLAPGTPFADEATSRLENRFHSLGYKED